MECRVRNTQLCVSNVSAQTYVNLSIFRLPQPGPHRPRGEGEQRERHLGRDQRPHQPLLQVTQSGNIILSRKYCVI